MAKQKREKPVADVVAELNLDFMRKTGGKVNTEKASEVLIHTLVEKGGTSPKEAAALMLTERYLDSATSLVAINNWYWGGRQIYRFDEELASALLAQTKDDLNISAEVFKALPVQDLFVERFIEGTDSYGFYFSVADGIIFISEVFQGGRTKSSMLVLNLGSTLSESIENTVAAMGTNINKDDVKALSRELSGFLQFVLYLEAVNADIEAVTSGAVIHKSAQHTMKRGKTEVSKVGYRVGAAIREAKNAPRVVYDGEHGKGSPKSPHIRRSHFHSFWTGSGENKELIVKWVDTVFVNGGVSEITTVHSVEGDEET